MCNSLAVCTFIHFDIFSFLNLLCTLDHVKTCSKSIPPFPAVIMRKMSGKYQKAFVLEYQHEHLFQLYLWFLLIYLFCFHVLYCSWAQSQVCSAVRFPEGIRLFWLPDSHCKSICELLKPFSVVSWLWIEYLLLMKTMCPWKSATQDIVK